jgi:hypothetical protein
MAQVAEYLLCKLKALSSNPNPIQNRKKKVYNMYGFKDYLSVSTLSNMLYSETQLWSQTRNYLTSLSLFFPLQHGIDIIALSEIK